MSIKQQTLEHYDRMIEWAEKQPPNNGSFFAEMKESLGESWFGDNCPYCQKNYDKNKCELNSIDNNCCNCCNGLWEKMYDTVVWSDWIIAAKKVREYIKENG